MLVCFYVHICLCMTRCENVCPLVFCLSKNSIISSPPLHPSTSSVWRATLFFFMNELLRRMTKENARFSVAAFVDDGVSGFKAPKEICKTSLLYIPASSHWSHFFFFSAANTDPFLFFLIIHCKYAHLHTYALTEANSYVTPCISLKSTPCLSPTTLLWKRLVIYITSLLPRAPTHTTRNNSSDIPTSTHSSVHYE